MKKILISTIICVVILSLVQVFVSNSFSTKGILLNNIEEKIKYYEKENAFLNEKLLMASSFNNISSQAGQLGFVEEKSYVSLTSPLPLALKR